MHRFWNKLALLGLVLATAIAAPGLFAQRRGSGGGGRPAPARPGPPARPAPVVRPGRPTGPRPRPASPGPASAVDRWNQMSPEERERALRKLPPDRQKQIRDRIEQFNKLPKDEQERLRQRYERFSKLPPEKQAAVRQDIQRFSKLAPDRRRALSQEFETLRNMPEGQRAARLNSEDFRNKYSPEEQRMIQELAQILPTRN